LGNTGRGSGLTLFGERRVGIGACPVSGWADGDGDGGGEAGTETGSGSGASFGITVAVTSGVAVTAGGASTTGTLVTIGVGTGFVADALGPGAMSAGPGHDWMSTTAPASAAMTPTTGNGHHRRARDTGSTAGTSVVVSASIGSKR
jgi:hypothetical protein